ncbi:MAG: hypothetical protein QOI54_2204 [Actinomycetota bacterium]|jgi:uncharacterized membrane protein HdeD (DUF308 family)|nr:hypothetical protein [Actinomycetota bacterium]
MSDDDVLSSTRRAGWIATGVGLLLVLGGVAGLLYVVIATITSAILFAWLLLVAGFAALIDAWRERGRDRFWPSALTGAANIAAGIVILWKPGVSLLALTTLVAVFFLVGGLFRLIVASARPVPGRVWMILHGLVDVVLAVLIIANLPVASFYVLGTLLSVSLLADGLALIMVGSAARHAIAEPAAHRRVAPGTPHPAV